jgi:hypothetical protein
VVAKSPKPSEFSKTVDREEGRPRHGLVRLRDRGGRPRKLVPLRRSSASRGGEEFSTRRSPEPAKLLAPTPAGQGWPGVVEPYGHDRTSGADRSVTVLAVAGVAILTGLGWVLSYAALRQLALGAGLAPWAATLWPFCIDLFVFVATLAAIADQRRGRSTAYAWGLAVAYSGATVAGNVLVAGPDHVAQAVHATPAVTMVLAWHLLSRFFDGRPASPRASGAHPEEGPRGRPDQRAVAAWVAARERNGQRATGAALAAEFGTSGRTGRRLLAELRGQVAGHAV